jgi:hypothetical protein
MHHSKEAVGKRPSAVQQAVRQAHGPDQSRPFAVAEAMAEPLRPSALWSFQIPVILSILSN